MFQVMPSGKPAGYNVNIANFLRDIYFFFGTGAARVGAPVCVLADNKAVVIRNEATSVIYSPSI